ncbi:MAG: hypothetical protein FJ279_21505, partial [Planctomycetes bacterium]|nr:hypothetical protein [Planctomycetota bacterium]
GCTMGWTENWLGWSAGPQMTSYLLAMLRAACKDQPLGMYVIGAGEKPNQMRMKFLQAIAGGARTTCIYNYGPHYCSIDSWAERYELYPAIRDVLHELGTYDALLEGAKRRPGEVALLYNRTTDIWHKDSSHVREAEFLYDALTQAQFEVEIVSEDDVAAGELKRFKALYVAGDHIERRAAEAIARWVRDGGVLCGTNGAGLLDEYHQPLPTLNEVFGVASSKNEFKKDASRPLFELRGLKPLATAKPTEVCPLKNASLTALSYLETLEPAPGAEVWLRYEDGKAAALANKAGKGLAVRFATFPGLEYIHSALNDEEYHKADSPRWRFPVRCSAELRDLIALAARRGAAKPIAQCSAPMVELARWDGPKGAVLFVMNHAFERQERVTLTIPDVPARARITAASGASVQAKPTDGGLEVLLPLGLTEVLMLQWHGQAGDAKNGTGTFLTGDGRVAQSRRGGLRRGASQRLALLFGRRALPCTHLTSIKDRIQ